MWSCTCLPSVSPSLQEANGEKSIMSFDVPGFRLLIYLSGKQTLSRTVVNGPAHLYSFVRFLMPWRRFHDIPRLKCRIRESRIETTILLLPLSRTCAVDIVPHSHAYVRIGNILSSNTTRHALSVLAAGESCQVGYIEAALARRACFHWAWRCKFYSVSLFK